MNGTFNAAEIFEIAIKIEQNGAKFYRKAALGFEDVNTRGLLNDLAGMEDEHEKIFAQMQHDFESKKIAPKVFDPEDQTASYLHAMADGRIFDVRANPADMLTGMESLEDILRTAIELEKESIVYYVGIRDVVPENLGKNQVYDIIREEMGHVVLLGNALKSLGK
jgi:rubrerythrin